LKDPLRLLVTVLFGNLLVNILFFCVSAVIAADLGNVYGSFYHFLAGIVILVSVIIFGEIMPKAIGVTYPVTVARLASLPILLWGVIAYPFREFFLFIAKLLEPDSEVHPRITAEELKMLLNMSCKEGLLDYDAGEMIEDIMELKDLKVNRIMIPRPDMICLPVSAGIKKALEIARANNFFYIIVYRGNDENIAGIINTREICLRKNKERSIESFIKPVRFIPETARVADALEIMTKEKIPLAVAVDEYGGLAGLVTHKDILREFIGGIDNPENGRAPEPVVQLSRSKFRVRGNLPVENWKEFFGALLPVESSGTLSVATVGGLVTLLLGQMPKEGDSVNFMNIRFTVEKMSGKRIESVIVKII
jgi:CBS domain containing-hemolysin-like protein